jgi:Spy/CpxP family protein refolding chaperone
MRKLVAVVAVSASWCLLANGYTHGQQSAYIGQQTRDIKALSPEEIDAYTTGKGFGMAKAAELNGYPGPAHVIELSAQLGLSPEQRAKTQALLATMQSKATTSGRALVEKERTLDQMFATRSVNPATLAAALDDIGNLQARVRRAHLEAHLAEAEILTPEQTARYAQLRGYGNGNVDAGHAHHHMQ